MKKKKEKETFFLCLFAVSRGSGRDLYLRRPLKKKSRANPTPLRTISSSIAVKSWSFPYTHTHTQIVFNFCRTEDVRD